MVIDRRSLETASQTKTANLVPGDTYIAFVLYSDLRLLLGYFDTFLNFVCLGRATNVELGHSFTHDLSTSRGIEVVEKYRLAPFFQESIYYNRCSNLLNISLFTADTVAAELLPREQMIKKLLIHVY